MRKFAQVATELGLRFPDCIRCLFHAILDRNIGEDAKLPHTEIMANQFILRAYFKLILECFETLPQGTVSNCGRERKVSLRPTRQPFLSKFFSTP